MVLKPKSQASHFETALLTWYKQNGRKHLPWRKKGTTPYEVWVSEIMLQQTQVSRVIEYFNRFVEKFPTVFDLAASTWEEFYPYYAGLGYYNRGRNMLRAAQMVVQQYKGKFPANKKSLLELPGVGEYTASAILSFGYNKNELAVDTNVKKVLGRVFAGDRFAALDFEQVGKNFTTNKKQLNAALMDLSSRVCLKIPRCGECPLQKICVYYDTDGRKELDHHASSKMIGKEKFVTKDATVYLCLHKNHKEYYSKNKKQFAPFILDAKHNTREKIKEYFRKKYNLELSVRPPHKKVFLDGKPVMYVNAQILMGKNPFYVFSPDVVKKVHFSLTPKSEVR